MKKTLIIASAALIFCTSFGEQIKLRNESSQQVKKSFTVSKGTFDLVARFETDLPETFSKTDFSYSSFLPSKIHLGRMGSISPFLKTGEKISGKTDVFIFETLQSVTYQEIKNLIDSHEGVSPNGYGLAQLWKSNRSELNQLPQFFPILGIDEEMFLPEVHDNNGCTKKIISLHKDLANSWSVIYQPFSKEIEDPCYVVFFVQK